MICGLNEKQRKVGNRCSNPSCEACGPYRAATVVVSPAVAPVYQTQLSKDVEEQRMRYEQRRFELARDMWLSGAERETARLFNITHEKMCVVLADALLQALQEQK